MTESATPSSPEQSPAGRLAELLGSLGLQRYARHAILLLLIGGMIWFARTDLLSRLPVTIDVASLRIDAASLSAAATPASGAPAAAPVSTAAAGGDLIRQTDIHTNIPNRPRTKIDTYTVQSGDTVFGIAEKFNLKPETIVWGNPVLKDDPHLLKPGQKLRIPPVDGVLRDVQPGDRLDVLARYYKVSVDDIVNWPGNSLDPEKPDLKLGMVLMVPGGTREFVQFVVPQIPRAAKKTLPADAGPGQCPGGYTGGAVGSGAFIWPANNHFLSGNNYWSGHPGIDIAAGLGDPIYAADSGVVVFAGWSNWGYGNMVVLDHGNGWQTLYAHLSQWNVNCGQSMLQGNLLGLAGTTGNSTGPHLHFEMHYQGARPNPFNYLPPP